jgi:hypothetical protein
MRRDYIASDEDKAFAEEVYSTKVKNISTKTPAEIEAWVDANATDPAGMRYVLKIVLRLQIAMLKRMLQR